MNKRVKRVDKNTKMNIITQFIIKKMEKIIFSQVILFRAVIVCNRKYVVNLDGLPTEL